MAKFTVKLDSKELDRQLDMALKRNPKATIKAVNDCTLDLLAQSVKRAPIESGELRGGAFAQVNRLVTGRGVKKNSNPGEIVSTGTPPASTKALGKVIFTGPYAVRQHEDLTLRHDRTDGYVIKSGKNKGKTVNMVAGGESKFLEKPFEERKQRYIERFKKIPDEVLK